MNKKKGRETPPQDIFCNWKEDYNNFVISPDFYVRVGVGLVGAGHCMLVPKQHCQRFSELPSSLRSEAERLERALFLRLEDSLGEMVVIEVAGKFQSVPHAHRHFIPKYTKNYSVNSVFETWVIRQHLAYEKVDDELLQSYHDVGYTLLKENGNAFALFDTQYGIEYAPSYRKFFAGFGACPESWKEMTTRQKQVDERRREQTISLLTELLARKRA